MQEEPAQIGLDADLTAEEIQMMQAMGIPFAFNTTQGQQVGNVRPQYIRSTARVALCARIDIPAIMSAVQAHCENLSRDYTCPVIACVYVLT